MNNRYIWGDIYERLFDDFLPLCTFGTSNLELKKCTAFKKSKMWISQRQCFTFNETSFTPKLGLNQGLNFVINYNYPATKLEFNQPSEIIVHDPTEEPDFENIQGRNFYVQPGLDLVLTIPTTILDSTTNFNNMGIESRHCNKHHMYKEINCNMDKVC